MGEQRDPIYRKHILTAIEEIEDFVQDMTYAQFEVDIKTQRAVARNLEIIGEAAKRLSEEFTDRHGSIPWRYVAGMRDFLIHDYAKMDMKEVWKAAIENIQELKRELESD